MPSFRFFLADSDFLTESFRFSFPEKNIIKPKGIRFAERKK